MMTKVQAVFFSDFRLISNFLEDCSPDVNKYMCGRIPTEKDEDEVCNMQTVADLSSLLSLLQYIECNHCREIKKVLITGWPD